MNIKDINYEKYMEIFQETILNAGTTSDIGLFRGKMGYLIFLLHYTQYTNNEILDELIDLLIKDVFQNINGRTPINIENGLCGIGWGIEYLMQNNLIDSETDDILMDIDKQIMERNPDFIKDFSFRTGLGGILLYVMVRLSSQQETEKELFNESYLLQLKKIAEVQSEGTDVFSFLCQRYLRVLAKEECVTPVSSELIKLAHNNKETHSTIGFETFWTIIEKVCSIAEFLEKNPIISKTYFLVHEDSQSAFYGIGTFIQQTCRCLKRRERICIITLRSKETSAISLERYEDLPHLKIGDAKASIASWGFKEFYRRYYLGVLVLLRATIKLDKENPVFHLNNMHMADLAIGVKLHNPKAVIFATVHYMDWALELLGNESILVKILKDQNDVRHNRIKTVLDENIRFMSACDKIQVISKHTYKTLTTICNIHPNKIIQKVLTIKDEYPLFTNKNRKNIKEVYGFSSKDILLIWAGRIEKLKGTDLLVKAFRNLMEDFPNLHLVIAGGGDCSAIFKSINPYWSKITMTGYVDKKTLYELFYISDIGIVPSLYEEFGLVAIEMMMMELPVIVGNNSGLEEIVDYGKSGIVLPLKQSYNEVEKNCKVIESTLRNTLSNITELNELKKKSRKRYTDLYKSE